MGMLDMKIWTNVRFEGTNPPFITEKPQNKIRRFRNLCINKFV